LIDLGFAYICRGEFQEHFLGATGDESAIDGTDKSQFLTLRTRSVSCELQNSSRHLAFGNEAYRVK